jgi:hypothetical protein
MRGAYRLLVGKESILKTQAWMGDDIKVDLRKWAGERGPDWSGSG